MPALDSTIPFYTSWNGWVTAYILPYFVWGINIIHLKSDNIGKFIIFMLHGCFFDFIAAR
jgi:hypothetical protein